MATTGQAPEAKVARMSSGVRPGQVPIVVAVTGHRNLKSEDLTVLTEAISGQLRELALKYPHSPCFLLSALAEGADRIVARCALDAGWSLGAVLPLPQNIYETDFSSAESLDEFRELLSRSEWVRPIAGSAAERPACYAALGDWLCSNAHLLMAVWDGQPERGEGGTAEVVRRFREGVPQEGLVIPETGSVIHVHARREDPDQVGGRLEVGRVDYLPPKPAGLNIIDTNAWGAALERIDQFNGDVGNFEEPVVDLRSVLPARGSDEAEPSELRSLFAVADRMAVRAQRDRGQMLRWLLLLAAGALVLAQVYSSLFTLPLLLCGAIALSVTAIVWYRLSHTQNLEQRYLDYRALAEACKVQHFWDVAGVDDAVTNYYLREQSGDLEWIRLAIRGTRLAGYPELVASGTIERIKWVRDAWLEDQRRYFLGGDGGTGKAFQSRKLEEIWSRRSRWLASAGASLMFLTAMFHLLVADLSLPIHDWLLRGLMASYSLVFGAAGLCKVYEHTSAFSEHAKKYERAGQVLQIAINQIDRALEAGDARAAIGVLKDFGIAALDENGDWLLMHRDRPVSAQGFG